MTEISSGLNEGDLVIIKTNTTGNKASTSNGKSILQSSGASGATPGGGFMPR